MRRRRACNVVHGCSDLFITSRNCPVRATLTPRCSARARSTPACTRSGRISALARKPRPHSNASRNLKLLHAQR
ncbi:hypothetical protein T492DRAFT_934754, partial [Pavlovales sp. CCMP2436]